MTTNEQEMHQRVSTIVQEELDHHFRQHPTFGPIIVQRAVDEFDEDVPVYIDIKIIFDGDQEDLDPHWTSGLIRRIRPKLLEIGVEEFPVPSFIEKNEWDQWRRRNPEARLEAD